MKRIFVLLVVTITGMTQSVKSQNVAVKVMFWRMLS